VNATTVSGASYRPVLQLVRRARQSLLLPAEAATSSRVHRPPAPGHQTIIEALGGKPSLPEPQPLIASLRDLQTVGALSDFSLVRLARQLPTLYISPVAPSSSFHRGGLARKLLTAELARPSTITTTSTTTARSRGAFSVHENIDIIVNLTVAPLIEAFFEDAAQRRC
jgi:hypothetical protein